MKRYRWFTILSVLLLSLLFSATALADSQYIVQPGDNLSKIAAMFGVTVSAIVEANDIANPNLINVGQVLIIPGGSGTITPTATTPAGTLSPGGTYTVKPGDSLSKIATMFGVTVQAIASANNITNPNLINVGRVLIIPGGGTGSSPVGPNPTPGPSPTSTPIAPPPAPIGAGSFELGGQTPGMGNRERMAYAGMTWVKFQHKWSPGDDPAALAGAIQEAHANGFKVLFSVTGANIYPAPGSIDFGAFAAFMGGLAAYGPDALEVWNEMNIDFEWPAGEINPATYVNEMLRPTYTAIKAANPGVLVISGALSPTGFDNGTNAWADNRYLAGMAAAGAGNYADCIGAHHNAGATSPTVSTGHPAGTHYSWYFGPTLTLYYNSFGGARKVCFTELGYVSPDGFGGISSAFGWGANTSVAEHAQWLAEAVSLSANSGKVRLLIVFNVDLTYYDPQGDPQAGYAMIRPDGSCPACETLHAVTGGN